MSSLSARKITGRIGYTVGTLYQFFETMEQLVERVNGETLAAAYEASKPFADCKSTSDSLRNLAKAFLGFQKAHPNEWEAVISYQFSPSHQWSEFYSTQVKRLLGLISIATNELYPEGEGSQQGEDVLVLWCGLYGISALSAANRLGEGNDPDRLIASLADMYLAARAKRDA